MSSATQQGRFMFSDGFSRLFSLETHEDCSLNTLILDSKIPFITTLTQCILKALSTQKRKPTLFIEGLDFLLAATNISPNDLLGLLANISSVLTPFGPFIFVFSFDNTDFSVPHVFLFPFSQIIVSSTQRPRCQRTMRYYS